MIQWVREKIRNRRTDTKAYWRKRFAADPESWAAVGDRDFSNEQNYQSSLQIGEQLTGVLLKYAAPISGKTLLDAGCGYGNFTDLARQLGFDAVGVDFCDLAVAQARQRFPQSTYQVADLPDLNLGRQFDVVITVNVLVAIADVMAWRNTLAGFERHLAPAGAVVVFEKLRQPTEETIAADHVAFRALEDYHNAFAELGLNVRHHQRVFLEFENIWKDVIVAKRP